MLIHQLLLDAAFSTLRSQPTGLSGADAAARQLEFGPNHIERLSTVPVVTRFVAQFTHFFAALLWVAAVLAFFASLQMPGQGMATLATAIVGVIVVNGAFAFWQEYRAEETMAALQRLLPHDVRAQRDGAVVVIPSEDVVPGDVILLSAGDNVPADCRLIEAFGVRVNNATLTGEARAVSRDAQICTEDDLLRSRNVLLAGTSVTTGEAKALVFATGMQTVFGGIARLTQSTADVPSPLQKELAAVSRLIAVLAVAIGLVVFAMGISGTDVAREASDVVLLDDNFASIVNGIEEGRAIFENIRRFLTYILTSNIPELVPYLAFAFARVPLALTIIQILAVDLGTDIVPALGLGVEPPDRGVMRRPPRRREDRLLTAGLLLRAYLFLGLCQAVAAMAAFFFVLSGAGWQWGQTLPTDGMIYREATTACLTAIVLMQVVNVHLCRSRRASVFSLSLFGNRLITAGIVAEIAIILLIDYTPAGHALFGTASLEWKAWLFVVPFAVAMLLLEEARKAFVRSRLETFAFGEVQADVNRQP